MKAEVEIEIEDKERDEDEDFEEHRKPSKLEIVGGLVAGTLFIVAIIAYLLVGFLIGMWHPTWVMFFAPIVISSLIVAIGKKKPYDFNYPLLVVAMYVLFSSLFGLWHPLWVLFITIPLYYSFIKLIKEIRKK